MPRSYELPEFSRHVVTAVLVAHDGARWLPRTLEGLVNQSRPVQRVVAVDTGSQDATHRLLDDTLGAEHVATRNRNTGFGAAVAYGLNAFAGEYEVPREIANAHLSTDIIEWVWLLHDDSEPSPDALHHLLTVAEEIPSVAVVGAKSRGWYDRRQLVEAGASIAPNGRRHTGLDRREQDQGQHDGVRDVLAVSSAGMLVRRDIWDQLGGFDRSISLMHDDVDFCWRAHAAGYRVVINTDAVVYHAEAASRNRRPVDTSISRPHYVDRVNGMYVVLANGRGAALPLAFVRLALGSVLRAVGMLVAKLPGHAADEVLAILALMSRPDRMLRGRRRRRRLRKVDNRELRPLFPPRGSQMKLLVESVISVVGTKEAAEGLSATAGRHRAAVETGPVAEEAEDLAGGDSIAAIKRFFLRPAVLLSLALSLLALLASRRLIGSGRLMGGALLPAPRSALDLWYSYADSWHTVGVGSGANAPPYLVVVATLATALAGSASLAVDLLVIGCVPMAGFTAYLAARRVVRSRLLRVWAAATYALMPAATGAVATGRLGSAVGIVLLPLIGLAAAQAIGTRARPGSMRATWATGLLLSFAAAFVPLAWLLAALLAVVAGVTVARDVATIRRLVIALAMPVILLLPWSLSVLRHPSMLLLEAGLPGPGLAEDKLSPLAVLLVHPGGPGMYPRWISLGLLLAALAALMRTSRALVVRVGWALGLTGFVVAIAMSRIDVRGPAMSTAAPTWPGFATALMCAGEILAALVAAEGARGRIAASAFGWRQPITLGLTALAAVTPVLAGGVWLVHGANTPVERRSPVVLPAYVAAEGQTARRPRTLVLRSAGNGALSYAILRDVGPRLGDADTAPGRDKHAQLDTIVARIGSGQARDEINQLADYAVQYVLVARPVDPELARLLDGVPGLTRVSTPDGAGLWRLPAPAARVRLVSADGRQSTALPSAPIAAKIRIAPSGAGRVLALAEGADARWHASLDGQALTARTINGWEQAFDVPRAGGVLRVWHDGTARKTWIAVQGFLFLVGVVLVLPGGRRRDEEDETEPEAVPLPTPRSRLRAGEAPPDEAAAPKPGPEPASEPAPEPAPVPEPVHAQPAYPPEWRAAREAREAEAASPQWQAEPAYREPEPAYREPEPAYREPEPAYREPEPPRWDPPPAYRQPQPEPPPYWEPQLQPEPEPEPEPQRSWQPEPEPGRDPSWRGQTPPWPPATESYQEPAPEWPAPETSPEPRWEPEPPWQPERRWQPESGWQETEPAGPDDGPTDVYEHRPYRLRRYEQEPDETPRRRGPGSTS